MHAKHCELAQFQTPQSPLTTFTANATMLGHSLPRNSQKQHCMCKRAWQQLCSSQVMPPNQLLRAALPQQDLLALLGQDWSSQQHAQVRLNPKDARIKSTANIHKKEIRQQHCCMSCKTNTSLLPTCCYGRWHLASGRVNTMPNLQAVLLSCAVEVEQTRKVRHRGKRSRHKLMLERKRLQNQAHVATPLQRWCREGWLQTEQPLKRRASALPSTAARRTIYAAAGSASAHARDGSTQSSAELRGARCTDRAPLSPGRSPSEKGRLERRGSRRVRWRHAAAAPVPAAAAHSCQANWAWHYRLQTAAGRRAAAAAVKNARSSAS